MIPNDDDITKTQLWQRIDDTISTIQNINQQFLSQVTGLPDIIQSQVTALLEAREKRWSEYSTDLANIVNQARLDFEVRQDKVLNDLKNYFDAKAANEDTRNNEFLIATQGKVQNAIDGYIEYVTKRLNDLSDAVVQHQADNEKAIKDYQVNLLQKFSDLQNRFEAVMSHLAALSKIVG